MNTLSTKPTKHKRQTVNKTPPKAKLYVLEYNTRGEPVPKIYFISQPIETNEKFFTAYCFNRHGVRQFNLDRVQNLQEFGVNGLRNLGFKVRVLQWRYQKPIAKGQQPSKNSLLPRNDDEFRTSPEKIFPRGGLVYVSIRTPDGLNLIGDSHCSLDDAYNKKDGIERALRRAIFFSEPAADRWKRYPEKARKYLDNLHD